MNQLPKINPTTTESWKRLQESCNDEKVNEPGLFNTEDVLKLEDIHFDFSNTQISQTIWRKLFDLGNECQLEAAKELFFKGGCINETENKSVLHPWLRKHPSNIRDENLKCIFEQRLKLKNLVNQIYSNKFLSTNKTIKHIVHVGIGGSDVGPRMAIEALSSFKAYEGKFHFVNTLEPHVIQKVLDEINSEEVLFIIVSKSFTTPETLSSAKIFKKYLKNLLGESWNEHFIGVTAHKNKALEFGLKEENILYFSDSVCGRFSMWSPVGITIALYIGLENFDKFLEGAECADQHFLEEEMLDNIPVKMALTSVYHINFKNIQAEIVLPYSHFLKGFPGYLQQISLESNGKSVDRIGDFINYRTAIPVFGEVGINAQHSFMQWLHQGTDRTLIDFIIVKEFDSQYSDLEKLLLSNAYGQIEAFVKGRPIDAENLNPHRFFKGGKPLLKIEMKKISPFNLGMLCALYEHKYFVQGVIWNIFSFDQWGVELGKEKSTEWLLNQHVNEN